MNRTTIASLFAAACAASAIAGNTLLVLPANVTLINMGFDLMRALPHGELEMVCYGGSDEVESLEYFDRVANRWIMSTRQAWDSGSMPVLPRESVVLVGDTPASGSLRDSARWANGIATPDGRAFHEILNAVNAFSPLPQKQWEAIAKAYGIRTYVIPVPSRYDRYKRANREVRESARQPYGAAESVQPVEISVAPAPTPAPTPAPRPAPGTEAAVANDKSLVPTEIIMTTYDEKAKAAVEAAAAEEAAKAAAAEEAAKAAETAQAVEAAADTAKAKAAETAQAVEAAADTAAAAAAKAADKKTVQEALEKAKAEVAAGRADQPAVVEKAQADIAAAKAAADSVVTPAVEPAPVTPPPVEAPVVVPQVPDLPVTVIEIKSDK